MDRTKTQAVTAAQMQEIDRKASDFYGVPSFVLMENAGRGAVEEIIKDLKKRKLIAQAQVKTFNVSLSSEPELNGDPFPNIIIVCGIGNNGGDGFVVARHLMIHYLQPKVFVLGKEEQLKGDALVNYFILKKMKCLVRFGRPAAAVLKKADCVVDAIFGIGLNRDITGVLREVIEDMNRYAKRIFALDIPSGLNATTGEIHGVCIKADKTITFHLPKVGMFRAEGLKYTGKIVVKNIGIGVSLMANSL